MRAGDPVRWGFLGAGFVASRGVAPAVHEADGAVLQVVAARDADRAASVMAETCAAASPRGFSQSTCLPASSAASTHGRWSSFGRER